MREGVSSATHNHLKHIQNAMTPRRETMEHPSEAMMARIGSGRLNDVCTFKGQYRDKPLGDNPQR